MTKNLEVARLLEEIADILELQEVEFKPRAYRKAARAIESLSKDIEEVYNEQKLEDIAGVGESIAAKIAEYLETGKLRYLEKLRKEVPIDIEQLNEIEGLGPKSIKKLYKELSIKNIKDLKKAAKEHKIKKLEGFGEKTEKEILEGITFLKGHKGRMLLGHVMPTAEEIKEKLSSFKHVEEAEIVGSYRRRKETVGDLDFLVVTKKPKKVADFFVGLDGVDKVLAKGKAKVSVRLKMGLDADLRLFKKEQYGAALMYFTGSKQHSVELRKVAMDEDYKLNEYGLYTRKKGTRVAGKTEEEIYKKIGLQFIPPEIRENNGEIEAAQKNKLPNLVKYKDVKMDLQMHSNYSDGDNTIKEMVKKAEEIGHKAIAITDHFGPLKIAHALDKKRWKKYSKEIDKIRDKSDIHIFKGAEVDIDKEGKLTAPKEILKEMDIVLAAVHSSFKMSEKNMTKRIVHALENYPVNILAHPTGRVINERKGYEIDFDRICEVAKKTKTALEINAFPDRLDLDGVHVRGAVEKGCKLSIGTDSHNKDQLYFFELGTAMGRRGWAEKKNIINTYTLKKLKKFLKKN